jgi:hypothetical protein
MPADLPDRVRERLYGLPPVSLGELEATASLQQRTDRKYLATWEQLDELLTALAGDHASLQIDGARVFTYRSRYFDSDSLGAFRAHVQGRRRRYKCRARHYVDSDRYVFEVKLKGRRGETVKHQLPCSPEEYEAFTARAHAFASEWVQDAYGRPVGALGPSLETHYRRLTLVAADRSQRVTVDFALTFDDGSGTVSQLDPGHVIVETKGHGMGDADRVLRDLGVRPVSCSKYCIGVGLLRDDVKANTFHRLLRRYFGARVASTG